MIINRHVDPWACKHRYRSKARTLRDVRRRRLQPTFRRGNYQALHMWRQSYASALGCYACLTKPTLDPKPLEEVSDCRSKGFVE